MKHSKVWFEADVEGLRAIQLGKPKFYALREIIQNAFDEQVTTCDVKTEFRNGKASFIVEDNSPIGFRDLKDAFTLFKDCYKRSDPTKRGRFNIGEKQAFSICDNAEIHTTKGTVIFDRTGRRETFSKRPVGTEVKMTIKMTRQEYEEILAYFQVLIVPKTIKFIVNGAVLFSEEPFKVFEANLMTEFLRESQMVRTMRNTEVKLYILKWKAFLYELGIPICEIDCTYSIDMSQRVPMSSDRDSVSQAYLRDLFAEVLNHTYESLVPEQSSDVWVREATSDERISKEAFKQVIKQRYGDKVVIATPTDPISIDDALSNGYRVVYGSEMSKAEWNNVKKDELVQSSHTVFGAQLVSATPIIPNENMLAVKSLAQKIALRFLGINVTVKFVSCKEATTLAQYNSETKTLTFNVSKLGTDFFQTPVSIETLDLIVHELGHEHGLHTESAYHETITKLAGQLVMVALMDPDFYRMK